MSSAVWVAIITSVLGPIILICFQELIRYFRHKKHNVLKDIQDGIKNLQKDTLRLQILNLIQHDPKNKLAINNLYDMYKGMGGNSYVTDIYKRWARGKLDEEEK